MRVPEDVELNTFSLVQETLPIMTPTPPPIFHQYAIEDVFQQLPIRRYHELVESNPMIGLGDSFNSWINSTSHPHGRGALDVFKTLVDLFYDDKSFLVYLLEKANDFSIDNYYEKQPLAGIIEVELEKMKSSTFFQQKSEAYKRDKLLSRYHIEFHFFLIVISEQLSAHLIETEIKQKLLHSFGKYLQAFDDISKRFELFNQGLQPAGNGVVWFAIDNFQDQDSLIKKLLETNNSYPLAWRFISPESVSPS